MAAQVGAQGTWLDANRDTHGTLSTADDTCKATNGSALQRGYADAFFVPSNPDVGYIVAASFSGVYFTANNLASTAPLKAADAGNAGTAGRVIAGDPENPSRMWSVNAQPYGVSTTAYTRDGFQTSDTFQIGNDSVRDFPSTGPADVDYAGGTVLAAGDTGLILNSIDGVTFYYTAADGALATERWNAVGLASGTDGAVGGDNGKLAVTTQASAVPDLTAPTGSITGPASATLGQPVAFGAAVADNAGGSGIDPAASPGPPTASPAAPGRADATLPDQRRSHRPLSFRDSAGQHARPASSRCW